MKTFLLASIMLALPVAGWSAPSPAVPYSALSPSDFKIIGGQVFVRLNSAIVLTNQTLLITANVNLTNAYFTINGTNLATVNPTDSYLPKRQSATNFIDSLAHDDGSWFSIDGVGTATLELNTDDGQITWPGGTNIITKSGSDGVYTNGDTDVKFKVLNGSAKGIAMEAQGNAGVLATSGGASSMTFRNSTDQISFSSSALFPTVSLTESLGLLQYPWDKTITSNLWVVGYVDALGTSYSRLAISHGGTNNAIHFDSQSAGTAGDPVQMQFDFGGTNRFVMHKDGMFNAGRIVITNSATSQIGVNIDRRGLLQLLGADTSTARYQVFDVFLNGTEVMPNQFFADMRTNSFYEFSAVATNRVGSFRFGTTEPGDGFDPVFQVSSNSVVVVKGITKAQKALITPVEGMIVRQTDNTPGLRIYQGGAWVMISTVADP